MVPHSFAAPFFCQGKVRRNKAGIFVVILHVPPTTVELKIVTIYKDESLT